MRVRRDGGGFGERMRITEEMEGGVEEREEEVILSLRGEGDNTLAKDSS